MTSFIKCLIILSFQLLFSHQEHTFPSEGYFLPHLTETTRKILSEAVSSMETGINELCNETFNDTFFNDNQTEHFVQKLFADSSKNKNDFLTYSSCMSSQNNITMTYLFATISINTTEGKEDKEHFDYPKRYHFGLCVPSGCDEYENIAAQILKQHKELFRCEAEDQCRVNLFEVSSLDNKYSFTLKQFLSLLPLLVIIVQVVLNLFPIIPYWLSIRLAQMVHMCRREKSSLFKVNALKKTFLRMKKAFSIAENTDELFNSRKLNSKINNETGLSYIKALRVISMMFFLLGTVFVMIIQSPSYISSEVSLDSLMKSAWFSFILFGIRYAPRIRRGNV